VKKCEKKVGNESWVVRRASWRDAGQSPRFGGSEGEEKKKTKDPPLQDPNPQGWGTLRRKTKSKSSTRGKDAPPAGREFDVVEVCFFYQGFDDSFDDGFCVLGGGPENVEVYFDGGEVVIAGGEAV